MQKRLLQIYELLYRRFGPRHWWPADTQFEVIVGAILTQSVAWRNVEKAIDNLRRAGLLSAEALAAADPAEVERHIVPTRYYRIKAKKLKAFVHHLITHYQGNLAEMFNQPLDKLRPELLGIYGIGPETADSILLYAGEYPIFVIDAYTLRIFQRLGIFDATVDYQRAQAFFMLQLPNEVPLFNEYHALLDALGHHICLAKHPKCAECPLQEICSFHAA